MKNSLLILTCCVLLSTFSTRASGQEAVEPREAIEDQIQTLSSEFLIHMSSSEYSFAAGLFHYPREYTSVKKSSQVLGISKMLKILTDEFGIPIRYKVNESPDPYYNVIVCGGDMQYWQDNPSQLQISLEVDFSKENNGAVVILFSNISNKWEIRAVAYGLPAQRPGARDRISEIMAKMLIALQPEPQKPPTNEKYPIVMASNKSSHRMIY